MGHILFFQEKKAMFKKIMWIFLFVAICIAVLAGVAFRAFELEWFKHIGIGSFLAMVLVVVILMVIDPPPKPEPREIKS